MSSNAKITAELAELQAALSRLTAVQSCSHISTVTQDKPTTKQIQMICDGSGAASPEVFRELLMKNWHGRLGRTHMVDVDQMSVTARTELDIYLRRTITGILPVGGSDTPIQPDIVFATLSAFGLRLEDRGSLANVTIFNDGDDLQRPTTERLDNFCAHYYTNGSNNFGNYWRASAMETVIHLARYRGLFTAAGFLKAVQ